MIIKTFGNGLLDSNTYLVWDETTREAMTVDCGNEPSTVASVCKAEGLKIIYIVLTHGHYDHADHVRGYKELFEGAPVVCHGDEVKVLTDPDANVSALLGLNRVYPLPDLQVSEGDILTLGKTQFTVMHVPGHTPGSICLYCEAEKTLFTGDTLFVRGYGRTDFKYGSVSDLIASLRRLISLDGDTVFYSGHGREGKLRNERYY